jgi:flavin-dependent thymidylate synthase
MKVELLSYTQNALTLLLKTKGTRLAHGEDPATWSAERREEHLAYMRDTIQSSWEFVDYIFKVSGVTRAFTHQFVRTRTGSYAQEAMRVIDAGDHPVTKPANIEAEPLLTGIWDHGVNEVMESYAQLLGFGVAAQDARGLLPTNITTSIMAKFNLRTLSDMAEKRLCTRTQGEYQDVFREMRRLVIEVHPWAEDFINVYCVNKGHCCFPRYGAVECPIYPFTIPIEQVKLFGAKAKAAFERGVRHEAAPRAVDGKAM